MKCPFRKRIVYTAGCSSGAGYPSEWITSEEFEDCIGEKCPAFFLKETYYPETMAEACALCQNK